MEERTVVGFCTHEKDNVGEIEIQKVVLSYIFRATDSDSPRQQLRIYSG